jgi:Fe-S-cluster containining protein
LRLPPEQREAIQQNAANQIGLIANAAPRLAETPVIDQWPDQDVDRLVDQYRDLPCPALQADGSCGVYAFRPLTCRSMGIPQETGGVTLGACDVQTSVPLIRVSRFLREEENQLAKAEADELIKLRQDVQATGEELFLPFAFLPRDVDWPGQ